MNKIGMIIGDRYELLEKIGTGGMADVYKAKCHKLNRFVAIKILKQEFNENKDFVSKFQIEAQATAGLMHTNIVNVYDVGNDQDVHYIVMELVEGITLKRYISKKVRLTVKESISIAIQMSNGIEAAHKNNIIHRDIKPQNIIISKDGKVKVTDFGIAKAVSSNTVSTNVMGSVHYTSPEQARGGFSDEKSDIYSLGVTMYEMITGRVPFNGETTVAIAIKHIQETIKSPKEIVPEIPVSLEQIILKCTEKSPDRRYSKMSEVIEDLKKSLLFPDENFVKREQFQSQSETKIISNEERSEIKNKVNSTKQTIQPNRVYKKVVKSNINSKVEQVDVQKERTKKQAENNKEQKKLVKDKKNDRIMIIAVFIVLALVVGLLIFIILDVSGAFDVPAADEIEKTVDEENDLDNNTNEEGEGMLVPGVVGKSEAEATAELERVGYVVKKESEVSEEMPKGSVIRQLPSENEKLSLGEEITIFISTGGENTDVSMPNLLGMKEEDAKKALEDKGLEWVVSYNNDTGVYPLGSVNYQSYTADSKVPSGSIIRIQVSEGGDAIYKYSVDILAPYDYHSGDATVVLVASTGDELFRTTTSTFPVNISLDGITQSPKGEITIIYYVPVEQTVTDADGNITTEVVSTEQREVYPVNFEISQ